MQNHEIVIVPKYHIFKGTEFVVTKISCKEVVKAMNDFLVSIFCDGTTLERDI